MLSWWEVVRLHSEPLTKGHSPTACDLSSQIRTRFSRSQRVRGDMHVAEDCPRSVDNAVVQRLLPLDARTRDCFCIVPRLIPRVVGLTPQIAGNFRSNDSRDRCLRLTFSVPFAVSRVSLRTCPKPDLRMRVSRVQNRCRLLANCAPLISGAVGLANVGHVYTENIRQQLFTWDLVIGYVVEKGPSLNGAMCATWALGTPRFQMFSTWPLPTTEMEHETRHPSR